MGSISSVSPSMYTYAGPLPAAGSSPTTQPSVGPAATVELSALQQQSQMTTVLFGGPSAGANALASLVAGGSSAQSPTGPAATVALSTAQQQSQVASALFGGLDVGGAVPTSFSLFTGGGMLSLLNAQGGAAMKYLTPQASPAGQLINSLA